MEKLKTSNDKGVNVHKLLDSPQLYESYGILLESLMRYIRDTDYYKAAGIAEKIARELREHGRALSELGI